MQGRIDKQGCVVLRIMPSDQGYGHFVETLREQKRLLESFDEGKVKRDKGKFASGGAGGGKKDDDSDDEPTPTDKPKSGLFSKVAAWFNGPQLEEQRESFDTSVQAEIARLEQHAPENDIQDANGRRIQRSYEAAARSLFLKHCTTGGYADAHKIKAYIDSGTLKKDLFNAAARLHPDLHGSIVRATQAADKDGANVKESFDEAKVKRDGGKFASKPGDDKSNPDTPQPGTHEHHADSWASFGKKLPGRALAAAASKVKEKYGKLETRYGRATAIAIMGAGIAGLPLPVPGSSFLTAAPVIAAAELYRYFSGGGKAVKESDAEPVKLSEEEIKKLGKQLLDELLAEWENDPANREEE